MHRLVTIPSLLSAVFVAVSAISKLWDLSYFDLQLASWRLFSEPAVRSLIVFTVPIVELAITALFLLVPTRRLLAASFLVGILLLFSLAYAIEAYGGPSPNCACFGIWARQFEFRTTVSFVLIRNGILIVPLICYIMLSSLRASWVPLSRGSVQGVALPGGAGSRERGFSLIEVLVVLAVIAVLVALAIPAIGYMRQRGRESVTLSNLRHHSTVFVSYAHDYRDTLPYFTVPLPGESSPIQIPGGNVFYTFYFEAYATWKFALSPGFYSGNPVHPTFRSPLQPAGAAQFFDYTYPCTFLADEHYWRSETRTFPPYQLRPVKLGDVAFPDVKVVISDEAAWNAPVKARSRSGAGGCIDGHAEFVSWGRMTPQYAIGDGVVSPFFDYTRHFGAYNAFLHTVGGASERDFRPPSKP